MSINRYSYCFGDPVNAYDPTGAVLTEFYMVEEQRALGGGDLAAGRAIANASRSHYAGAGGRNENLTGLGGQSGAQAGPSATDFELSLGRAGAAFGQFVLGGLDVGLEGLKAVGKAAGPAVEACQFCHTQASNSAVMKRNLANGPSGLARSYFEGDLEARQTVSSILNEYHYAAPVAPATIESWGEQGLAGELYYGCGSYWQEKLPGAAAEGFNNAQPGFPR